MGQRACQPTACFSKLCIRATPLCHLLYNPWQGMLETPVLTGASCRNSTSGLIGSVLQICGLPMQIAAEGALQKVQPRLRAQPCRAGWSGCADPTSITTSPGSSGSSSLVAAAAHLQVQPCSSRQEMHTLAVHSLLCPPWRSTSCRRHLIAA